MQLYSIAVNSIQQKTTLFNNSELYTEKRQFNAIAVNSIEDYLYFNIFMIIICFTRTIFINPNPIHIVFI